VTLNQTILGLAIRGRSQDTNLLAKEQLAGLSTDELGVEVTQHTSDGGIPKVLTHVSKQLEQGIGDGGP